MSNPMIGNTVAELQELMETYDGKPFQAGAIKVRHSGRVQEKELFSFTYYVDGIGSYENHKAFIQYVLEILAEIYDTTEVYESNYNFRTTRVTIMGGFK